MPGNANPLNNPGAEHRSANAQERLTELGFEVEEARDFLHENLLSLEFIYEVCLAYGIDTDMIAEILALDGIDGTAVASYFAENGIDPTELGGSQPATEDDETDDSEESEEDGAEDSEDESDATDESNEGETPETEEEVLDIVEDGNYSGVLSATNDLFSFEGLLDATVTDDQIIGEWSIADLDISGDLSGTVDNETGEYTLSDEDYDLVITGVITSDGTWSAGFLSGTASTSFDGIA
jgi:hypothetical protein